MNRRQVKKKKTAVIIEDVDEAIVNLSDMIDSHVDQLELMGTAKCVFEGVKLINRIHPDVVFLDIEMPDGNGFDLLDMLPGNCEAQVIFTTGSEEYAIRAFRYAAVDYLLKPIDPNELKEAVQKVIHTPTSLQQKRSVLNTNRLSGVPTKLALHTQDEVRIISINDIIRCKSLDNYCQFMLEQGEKILVSKPLKEYDILLKPAGFIRVHQSHLVNFNKIKSYIKREGGYLQMIDDSHVPVAVRKKAELLKMLQERL